jgi:Family of unknown function (DUF6328)
MSSRRQGKGGSYGQPSLLGSGVPGLQALFGFQLIAIFNRRFETLTFSTQALHLVALFLTAISIALIMAPAAYHRIAEPEFGSEFFVHLTSKLIAVAMVPLVISLTLDVYLVTLLIVRNVLVSAAMAISVFAVFAGLWFAYPLVRRRRELLSTPT